MHFSVTVAGLLLGTFGHRAAADSPRVHQAFIWIRLRGAMTLALPARVLWRVPADIAPDAVLARRRKK